MAQRPSFFQRIAAFFERLVEPQAPTPATEKEPSSALPHEEASKPTPVREWQMPEFIEPTPGVDIGPYSTDDTIEHILDDLGIEDDPYAEQLLREGWFTDDNSMEDRWEARQRFFDYTDLENFDFPWDDWREWYNETAA